jgi:hypothetical protein
MWLLGAKPFLKADIKPFYIMEREMLPFIDARLTGERQKTKISNV